MHQPQIPPTSPVEGLKALTRSLSEGLEFRGLIWWLLSPLLKFLIRRRLKEFERAIEALAELAEKVANGTYQPPKPRTRKATTQPHRDRSARDQYDWPDDWPELPWPTKPEPEATEPPTPPPRPRPLRRKLRPCASRLRAPTLPPRPPPHALHPGKPRKSQIFDESAPTSDARPYCST
jgi:hypothetical protein